jgi:hypothetical protein
MITTVSKLLVFLNVFAAVAILSWALSAYLNRIDPAEAADEKGEKLTDKVKRLNGELTAAQSVFGPTHSAVSDAEIRLADIKAKIAARDKQASTGGFYDIFDTPRPGEALPPDSTGLERLRRINWSLQLPPARQIKGADGTPLKGVEVVQRELEDEGGKITAFAGTIKDSVAKAHTLSDDIRTLNSKSARLARILAALEEETAFLADQKINWFDQTVTLNKRNAQLSTRLKDLGATTKVGVTPPAVTLNTVR